jgi:hypothetical protein
MLELEEDCAARCAAYPNQPPAHAYFKVCNSGDTAMPLTIKTTGAFGATGTGCDPIAPGECCSIDVNGGSSFSTGSLDVSTSTPYPQSVSVPLVGVPVNM